jgi:transcriptional regulator with XRE-family HTH domain
MARVQNRLLALIMEKERQSGRRIQQLEIARDIGVTEQLVGRWVKNQIHQYDGDVIVKLCDYFGCEIADLLYIDRE